MKILAIISIFALMAMIEINGSKHRTKVLGKQYPDSLYKETRDNYMKWKSTIVDTLQKKIEYDTSR
jgi:hypothetical protein